MLNSNIISDWNYNERFLRFFNCLEPHNRFFKKFKKPSPKQLKNDGMKKKFDQ